MPAIAPKEDMLMLKIVLFLCAFVGIIAGGLKKLSQLLANDLIAILKKAHLGKLPAGECAAQYLSVQQFSRDALRLPMDAAALQQMDSCETIHKYDVACRIVSSKATFKRSTICLSVSISFDGERNNGERVQFEVKNALISAVVVLKQHTWQLTDLHAIAR